MTERVLDRLPSFDERSRNFPIRTLVADKAPRSYSWSVPNILDQGQQGACVGFGWAHELAARPISVPGITNEIARGIYYEAQKADEWPGEDYSGTSVLAGAKIITARGYQSGYRWCFGLNDLILAVGYTGPVVMGTYWYEGMFEPDANGFIHPTGNIMGGHCWDVTRVAIQLPTRPVGYFTMVNSWGSDWGRNGTAKVTFGDMATLLAMDGEACVPTGRRLTPVAS